MRKWDVSLVLSRAIIAVLITGIWVNASEFFRNEVLLKGHWTGHYSSLGMSFPSEPLNGMIWVVWGFIFAATVYLITRKFSLLQAALISWVTGFVMMWLVIFNLGVLPSGILVYAMPLSLLEAFVAAYICRRISAPNYPS
jgi:hypothetical protein